MARPSSSDTVEKFRFRVSVLTTAAFPILNFSEPEFQRAGFSEVVIPKVTIGTINYRENINTPNFRKQAGLVRYDDLVLKRGVTTSQDLYKWCNSTNNVILGISSPLAAIAQGFSELAVVPAQDKDYRRDLIVSVVDRLNNSIKMWFFYDCIVSGYKPGSDLDAKSDEKLVEELTISFETMIESNKPTENEAQSDINNQIESEFAKAALAAIV